MASDRQLLAGLIERSLDVEHFHADVTPISRPHSTGWRTLPSLVTAQLVDGRSLIEFDGKPSVDLRHGESLCIPGGVRHCITLQTPGQACSRWSHLQFRLFTSIDAMTLLEPPPVIGGAPGRRIGDLNAELTEAMRDAEPTLASIARKKRIGYALLDAIAEASPGVAHGIERLREAQRVAPVLAYIDANLGLERLDLTHLARIADLSPSRFHAVFKRALGVAPSRYLQSRRMRRAEELLIASDRLINEVAAEAGYQDPFHFSRLFKKLHGESPLAYRERTARAGL